MKKILFILILGAAGYLYYLYKYTPSSVSPYPYLFANQSIEGIDEANESHVLIIGDRMGVRLNNYIPDITEHTSKGLKTPLRIVNWSREHEGLHRTLRKLKKLSSFPKLIIYHGASEEFYEKRFTTKDQKTLIHNFRIFADDRKLSLIMTFPFLSKFIYRKMNYYHLSNDIKENKTIYPAPIKQVQMQMGYRLYKRELLDLITLVKEKGSMLALMTTPINLEIDVKEVCKNSISTSISREQNEINRYLMDGDAKSAYVKAAALLPNTPGNATSYALVGKSLSKMGRFQEARENLENATAFDCKTWRSSIVFNNIIRKVAKQDEVLLVDFDDSVNRSYGKNVTFLDDLYPQEIFYEELVRNIKKMVITTFSL